MKQAPLLLFAGTAAGFVGILGLHLRQAPGPGPSRQLRRAVRPP